MSMIIDLTNMINNIANITNDKNDIYPLGLYIANSRKILTSQKCFYEIGNDVWEIDYTKPLLKGYNIISKDSDIAIDKKHVQKGLIKTSPDLHFRIGQMILLHLEHTMYSVSKNKSIIFERNKNIYSLGNPQDKIVPLLNPTILDFDSLEDIILSFYPHIDYRVMPMLLDVLDDGLIEVEREFIENKEYMYECNLNTNVLRVIKQDTYEKERYQMNILIDKNKR